MNNNLPAFPLSRPIDETLPNIGLTKREYLAAMAMQGILAGRNEAVEQRGYPSQEVALWAIQQADELLKQLES